MKKIVLLLIVSAIIYAPFFTEKDRLDREVKRLCAIDGGIKVYETVKLLFCGHVAEIHGTSSSGDTFRISNIEAAPPIDIIIEDQTQISGSPSSKNHSQQALIDTQRIIASEFTRTNTKTGMKVEWRLVA